jgi:hypothetical protein
VGKRHGHATEGLQPMMPEPKGPVRDDWANEQLRAASACRVMHATAVSLGEAMQRGGQVAGPLSQYGEAFLQWADQLRRHAERLEGSRPATRPAGRARLRLVDEQSDRPMSL